MWLVNLCLLLVLSSPGAFSKDVKRGTIGSLHLKHSGSVHALHSLKRSASLVLDDSETVTNTTVSPEPADTNMTSTDMDGSQLIWTTSEWSDCSTECGPGNRERSVGCFNNDTKVELSDDACMADQFVIPSTRPESSEDCDGACITCTGHEDLFVSIGLSVPPTKPIPSRKGTVCKVADTKYSCCDKRVENTIVTQVISIQKGFDTIPPAAAEQIQATIGSIANSTADFQARMEESQQRLLEVGAVLAAPSNLKVNKGIFRALSIVQQVLTQRVIDLEQAVENSTAIVALIKNQLSVLMTETTTPAPSGNSTTLSSVSGPPTLSDCVQGTVDLFASMSCAACNPSFVTDNLFEAPNSATNAIAVSSNTCAAVYKQCSPTIRDSRKYLRQALGVMRKIHSNLAKAASRIQPALLEVWSSLTFDWLPGSSRPLSAMAGAEETFVPDVTSLDCIKNVKAFVLPASTQLGEFCDNFFASWNYQFTIQNILKDVDKGTTTFGILNRCDKCLHTIVTKLATILSESKGGLDVTLALSPEALAEAGCVGLSSTPAKSPNSNSALKEALLSGQTNFFAIGEGDSWSAGEVSQMARKSQKAISLILAKAASRRDAVTPADSAALGVQQAVPFIRKIVYTDTGLDPNTLANVSWSIINNATQNPPPSIWDLRWSSEVGIIASDLNCTSHASCNPESGDSPYWFCAKSSVCNGTIPCDPNEAAMLHAHARCVKGLCVDDGTAVDGKCPDIAICPQTKSGQFDHAYFSRFKNVAPQPAQSGA